MNVLLKSHDLSRTGICAAKEKGKEETLVWLSYLHQTFPCFSHQLGFTKKTFSNLTKIIF